MNSISLCGYRTYSYSTKHRQTDTHKNETFITENLNQWKCSWNFFIHFGLIFHSFAGCGCEIFEIYLSIFLLYYRTYIMLQWVNNPGKYIYTPVFSVLRLKLLKTHRTDKTFLITFIPKHYGLPRHNWKTIKTS